MVKRNQRGITLIALVITIIVLLILAGVTINVLLGDNGILGRTQTAATEHEKAAVLETLKLAVAEGEMECHTNPEISKKVAYQTALENSGATITSATDEKIEGTIARSNKTYKFEVNVTTGEVKLIDEGGIPTTPPGATTYTVTFKDGETTLSTATVEDGQTVTKPADPTKDGFEFVNWYSDSALTTEYDFTSAINGNTTIYAKWEEVVTEPTIKLIDGTTRPITTADYGRKVSYLNADGSGQMANKTWRLFYVDNEDGTETGKGYFGDDKGTIYLKADWTDNNYTPSSDLTYSAKTKVKQLNPDWATQRGNNENDWKNNEKAAARLCDPDVWELIYKSTNSKYSGKINWVVGAPSAEMFMKSYSQKVSGASNYGAKYDANGTSAYGYKYTIDGSNYKYYTIEDTISPSQANGMYLKYKGVQNGIYCCPWLSSPSINGSDYLCFVSGNSAKANYNKYDLSCGVCPLVSLKYSVVLQEID